MKTQIEIKVSNKENDINYNIIFISLDLIQPLCPEGRII